jgi:hypothetical protein
VFFWSIDYEQIWLRSEEEPPEKQRHAIQHPKMMVATAWISLAQRASKT